jgi:phage replication O-like protein O
MANPQVEHGHIDIANELGEKFARLHLSGNEWQILWHIFRKTYGWHKKSDTISLSQFQNATGLSRPSVNDAIKLLVGKRVLVVVEKRVLGTEYLFNKNYEEWSSREKSTSTFFGSKLVPKRVPKLVPKRVHTKETKENIQKKYMPTAIFSENIHLLLWEEIVGTTLRSKLPEQVRAAERMERVLSPPKLKEILQVVRIIKQDKFGHRGLQIKLVNYVGLEKNLEEVEGIMQGMIDNHRVNSANHY